MYQVQQIWLTLKPYCWRKLTQQQKKMTVLMVIAMLLTVAFSLSLPFIFKWVIEYLSLHHPGDEKIIMILIAMYLMVWLLANWLMVIREMLSYKPVAAMIRAYVLAVFSHLHYQSMAFHLDRETGRVMRAIQEAQLSIAMLSLNVLFRALPTVIEMVVISIILAITISLKVAVILVLALISFVCIQFILVRRFKTVDANYQNIDASVDKRVVDSLLNSDNIKYLHAEDHEIGLVDKLLEKREKTIIGLFWFGTASTTVGAGILGLSLMAIYYLTGRDVLSDKLILGDFILVNSYLIILFDALERFTGFLRSIVSYFGSLSHASELLQISHSVPEDIDAKDIAVDHADIEFQNVSFAYQPKRPIFQSLDLKISKQSRVGIVGASGSGKSTIARLLFRFYDVDQGKIIIDGQNIKHVKKDSLRRLIAFVPQDVVLLNQSLKANIAYGNRYISDEAIDQVVASVKLDTLIKQLPDGLDTLVGERGVKLSGGEKQRVAIARALLKKPKIMVFDEATSSLDSRTESEIQRNIWQVSSDITTLIIAHRLKTIEKADWIVVLDQGRVVEQGIHQDLLSMGGYYCKLWNQAYENS